MTVYSFIYFILDFRKYIIAMCHLVFLGGDKKIGQNNLVDRHQNIVICRTIQKITLMLGCNVHTVSMHVLMVSQ